MFGKKKIQVDFEKLKYYDEFEKEKSDAAITDDLTGKTDTLKLYSEDRLPPESHSENSNGVFAEQFEPEGQADELNSPAEPMPLTLQNPVEEVAPTHVVPTQVEEPSVRPVSEPLNLTAEDISLSVAEEAVAQAEPPKQDLEPLELSVSDAVAEMEAAETASLASEPETASEFAPVLEDTTSAEEYVAEAVNFSEKTVEEEAEVSFVPTAPVEELGVEEIDSETVALAAIAAEKAEAKPAVRRSGRTKTRLLGFEHSDGNVKDIFAAQTESANAAPVSFQAVGWIVVISGPGRGHSIPLNCGVSQIGRGDDQAVQLDFGDNSISRSNHASIAYDEEKRQFFVGHGGKSNIVRLNDSPVLSTESMNNGDRIRIGETTLQLVAFCNEEFSWSDREEKDELDGARQENSPVSAY